MAEQPKYFDIEDTQTGKKYRVETDDPNATYDEAVEYFSSLPETEWQQYEYNVPAPAASAPAPVAAPAVQGQVTLQGQVTDEQAQAIAEQAGRGKFGDVQLAVDSLADPDYMANQMTEQQQRQYLALANNPNVTREQLTSFTKSIGRDVPDEVWGVIEAQRKTGNPFQAVASDYQQKLEELVPSWATTTEGMFATGPEGDNWLAQTARSWMGANQEGSSGIIGRALFDWTDAGGENIDRLFPNLTPEERENLQSAYAAYIQRNVREDNERASANDSFIPWFIGQATQPDAADLFGFKPAKLASKVARTIETGALVGGAGAIADVGYQAADIQGGVQDEFDVSRTGVTLLAGSALGATARGVAEITPNVFRRTPDTPAPASNRPPIVVPEADGRTKAYKTAISEAQKLISEQVDETTKDWTNAPEINVHDNFGKLQGIDNTAVAVYTTRTLPDGSNIPVVHINTASLLRKAKKDGIKPEALVEAAVFHETLGHHGLLSMYGKDLETFLDNIYTNGDAKFRAQVDKWLKDNPSAYGSLGPERRRIFATEEVLAETSEHGLIVRRKLDEWANYIKEFVRNNLGPFSLNLKYSQREIRAYLAMAHDYTVRGLKSEETSPIVKNMEDGLGSEVTDKYMRGGSRKTGDEGDFESRMTEILTEIRDAYEPTTRSQAEARRAASIAGLRSRQYKSEKGLEDLDVRLFQYDQVNDRYQSRILRLAERRDNARDANEYVAASDELKRVLYEYKLLSAKIQGDQAQIGRALAAMRALNMTKKNLNETLGILDGTFKDKTEAEAFAALDDPEVFDALVKMMTAQIKQGNTLGAAKIAEKVGKPYWWQYVLSYLHNSMLSGLGTHAVNAYDAVNVLGRKLEERVVGGTIGQTRKALGAKDTMSFMEGVGFTYGVLRAFVDAETYRNTYRAFKEGYEFQPFDARIERQDARIPGLSVINDALYASDMFWRSFHMSANLYSLGVRKAYKDGFRGKQLFEEAYANAINGDKDLFDEAKRHADEALLVDKPSAITSWIEAGKHIKPNMTLGEQARAFTLNLAFPFLRVSDRLVFQALKRVPLVAFLDHNTRREWAMGGAARDAVMARQLMGAALLSYYWMMADPEDADKEGYIEGYGDPDYQKTQALEATGYRPESVVEEDQVMRNANQINITANPFNTRNNLAVLVASIRQGWERSKKEDSDANEAALLLTSAMRAAGTFIMKQGYADNVTPYVQAIKADPQQETSVANAAGELASRAVPALVRQLNQMYFDPVKRDTTGDKSFEDRVLGRVQSGLPGLSNLMPANVTALGEEQQQGRTLLRLGDGTPVKQGEPYEELRKLEREFVEPVLTEFKGSFTYEGKSIKLNSFEKNKWQTVQGNYVRDEMLKEISSPGWNQLTSEEKRSLIKEVKAEAYEYAKEQLLDEILTARGL